MMNINSFASELNDVAVAYSLAARRVVSAAVEAARKDWEDAVYALNDFESSPCADDGDYYWIGEDLRKDAVEKGERYNLALGW